MGDPAGIGPEIIVGAWSETVVHEWCRPVVVGHPEIIRRAVDLWQTGLTVVEIDSPEQARPSPDVIPCIPCGSSDVLAVVPGTLDARAGQAAYDAVLAAIRLALAEQGRRHRDRAAAKRGAAPGGPRLSGPHRTAGPRLRRRRLCDDAVPGAQRGRAFAGRVWPWST